MGARERRAIRSWRLSRARWPVYALAAAGLATEVLEQATLHVGPLSVSQPLLVIVDPITSIMLSVCAGGSVPSEPARARRRC